MYFESQVPENKWGRLKVYLWKMKGGQKLKLS